MKTSQIRQLFLNYFHDKQHEIVPSSSLVPSNDPTLLFTNAGMVQFKETFLGLEDLKYTRATSSQRCVRAGGKHNDLENVGYTARHHTFFEMLGNFSFGDYFKREAMQYAWNFLTKELNIPEEKLWVTVYLDDDEAADIWLKELKINPERFSRCGEEDNFWSMGDTGPCGPCSEIFYDHGSEIAGGPPGSPDADGDRYIEIWNLVFMQYNRSADGALAPLPKPSVDTGMGLERIAAVVQGVHNNYDIDLFQNIIHAISHLAKNKDIHHPSYKVIADHLRSCSFLILDGVIPSNEGRGYVLRRIIRRAARHGHQLGLPKPFFHCLVGALVTEMSDAYPDLMDAEATIEQTLLREEEQFERTLEQGLKIFEASLEAISGNIIPGDIIFKLYDTYGFPVDLTADIARERKLQLDMNGFEQAMKMQQKKSQSASQFAIDYNEKLQLDLETHFTGYDILSDEVPINVILKEGGTVAHLSTGDEAVIVLKQTPFYAEAGGQVGDKGEIRYKDALFIVEDTTKLGKAYLHHGVLKTGQLNVNDHVTVTVDDCSRQATMLNHSATHLLHAALKQLLGQHVNQKGSLVDAERLRFDFTHFEPLTQAQIQQIEQLVNAQIRVNDKVITEIMTPEQAKQNGAVALFGEKYGEQVRVLTMGDFSKELCGGTHVKRTGDIGFFKITSEVGIASGVRRIEALTGDSALKWLQNTENNLIQLSNIFKADTDSLVTKARQFSKNYRELEKEMMGFKEKQAQSAGKNLADSAIEINGVKVLAAKLPGAEAKSLRTTLDMLKNKLDKAVVVLVTTENNKMNVIAGVTKNCIGKVPPAKEYVRYICGKGGGRDDMAQGGSELIDDLDEKLANIINLVAEN